MATATKSNVPEYCAVPMADTDVKVTAKTEHYAVPFTAAVKSFEDENTRLIFTQKVLLIFLLQAVEVGVIVMIVIACCDSEWGDMGYKALGYSTFIYLVTLVLMVVIHLYFKDVLHKTYNYFILVICPATVALLILSLLAVSYTWYERYLLIMTFLSWLCYVLSAVVVLTFVYYTLHFEQKKQPENLIYIIASAAFPIIYYGGISFIVCNENDFGITYLSRPAIISGLFLYLHYFYVLHDINTMTGSNYRLNMTPHNYVEGAVNLQIDFVFIIKDYLINVLGLIGKINVDGITNIFRTTNDTMSTKEEAKACTQDPKPKAGDSSEVSVPDQASVGFETDQTVYIPNPTKICTREPGPKARPSSDVTVPDQLTLGDVCGQIRTIISDSITTLFGGGITREEKAKNPQSNSSAELSSNDLIRDQSSVGFLTDQTVDVQDEIITPKYAVPKYGANSLSDVPEVHRPFVAFAKLRQTADIEGEVKTCPEHPVPKEDGNPSSVI